MKYLHCADIPEQKVILLLTFQDINVDLAAHSSTILISPSHSGITLTTYIAGSPLSMQ